MKKIYFLFEKGKKRNGFLVMKRIDFEHGTVTGNILGAALPMLVAQILNLLYNIVDRIYIARIPNIGTAALGAVGLCFPLIVVITAFSNLFGSGGAPLFSIYRGKGEPQRAANVMNTSFTMVCVCAVVLMAVGFIFARPLLVLFGASTDALVYAYPYLMIYLIGTLPSMIATGMNPFINAQGYSTIGMILSCGWCSSKPFARSAVYFCVGIWSTGGSDCHSNFPSVICGICVCLFDKKI